MMKVQLKVTATKSGSNVTRTYNNISTTASNEVLEEFGTKLIALTTNAYEKTEKITTINVGTEG